MTEVNDFFDDEGFFGPAEAAQHIVLSGGFSTPEIEAIRMINEGGVSKDRALKWLVERPPFNEIDNDPLAWIDTLKV